MSNETISNKPAGRVLDLTSGSITGTMLRFALPMIAGNLLQQLYNVADTLIVGRFLGSVALAAVGSSYTLMTFLTSILLGLCMGSGAFFSIRYGEKDFSRLRAGIFASFTLIAALTFVINAAVFLWIDPIMRLLSVPVSVYGLMREYLWVIFFRYRRHVPLQFLRLSAACGGQFMAPLIFLGISAVLNIVLDLVCVLVLHWGVAGAAAATVFAQWISGIGLGAVHTGAYAGPACFPAATCVLIELSTEISHFSADLHAAICHEFRYFDGTGPGEQLRAFRHGRICRRGKNRLPSPICPCRISATHFHLHRSKITAPKKIAFARGLKARSEPQRFLPSHLHIGVPFCKAASLDFLYVLRNPRSFLSAWSICASRALFTAASAHCSCYTVVPCHPEARRNVSLCSRSISLGTRA